MVPVVPVILEAVLQTFGGTDGWDRWDHHERLPIRAGSIARYAGPTDPTRRYHLFGPNPVQYHWYHQSYRRNVRELIKMELHITTTPP